MAQRVVTLKVDDIDGSDLGDGGETVTFAIGGTQYEMDLSDKNADKFRKDMEKYVSVARKVSGGRSGRRSSTGGSGRSKEELQAIRTWARENGHEVNERGRISQTITDAYHSATGR